MARRISKLQLFTASLVVMSATILCLRTSKTYASTITVSSPANGQQFTGNDFDVSGVADADATPQSYLCGTA